VLFIVNDRLDVALATEADGVHLGQEDLPLHAAKKLAPPGFIIGISAVNVEQAKLAEKGGTDGKTKVTPEKALSRNTDKQGNENSRSHGQSKDSKA